MAEEVAPREDEIAPKDLSTSLIAKEKAKKADREIINLPVLVQRGQEFERILTLPAAAKVTEHLVVRNHHQVLEAEKVMELLAMRNHSEAHEGTKATGLRAEKNLHQVLEAEKVMELLAMRNLRQVHVV